MKWSTTDHRKISVRCLHQTSVVAKLEEFSFFFFLIQDLPPIHGYDEIEESLDDENYDRLEVY